jgi:hypothetical protein
MRYQIVQYADLYLIQWQREDDQYLTWSYVYEPDELDSGIRLHAAIKSFDNREDAEAWILIQRLSE